MVRAPLFVPIYFNKMPFYNKRFSCRTRTCYNGRAQKKTKRPEAKRRTFIKVMKQKEGRGAADQ